MTTPLKSERHFLLSHNAIIKKMLDRLRLTTELTKWGLLNPSFSQVIYYNHEVLVLLLASPQPVVSTSCEAIMIKLNGVLPPS